MINQKVRNYLIKVAKEKRWTYYSEVNEKCNLGFNLNLHKDNNALADMLGEISEYEINNKRPMLSVVVVHYTDDFGAIHQCGDGFFRWAEKLGVKDKKQPDFQFFREQLKRCFDHWNKK
jgi:hypothetical protein